MTLTNISQSSTEINDGMPLVPPESSAALTKPALSEITLNLGIWVSGLLSFSRIHNHAMSDEARSKATKRSWAKEFSLVNVVLLSCAQYSYDLVARLSITEKPGVASGSGEMLGIERRDAELSLAEAVELNGVLRGLSLTAQAGAKGAHVSINEWLAWCDTVEEKLGRLKATEKVVFAAEYEGSKYLPKAMIELLDRSDISSDLRGELNEVLPRIAKILKWLNAIDEMRQKDLPLKPSLVLFARIYEQVAELTRYIKDRLERFPEQESEIFGSLDGTAYVASIETKKVFNFELSGISEIRQSPLIFAKIETAYALLNDCFQQTVVNFARMIEPAVEARQMFPAFTDKFEQSVILRKELWSIQKAVQKAEQDPENYPLPSLNEKLQGFVDNAMHFLMYKDRETVERFVEEVMRTKQKKDLVPILNRFGAYVETLLGQVNMRTVLADHPFDYPRD